MIKNKKLECNRCINTTTNPSVTLNKDGMCNVCENYLKNFNPEILEKELHFLKTQILHKKYDVMVGLSGGKDSTATLYSIKQMGFTALGFTFDIGYTESNIFEKAKSIAEFVHIDYERINIKKYVNETDKSSFEKMADLYDETESEILSQKFKYYYAEGRKHYSAKDNTPLPFVRPCQICRKIAIRAYYAEARKRNINVVAIGINEWTGLSGGSYSAIRKLQPFITEPPVYIVHLPYLLQRKSWDTKEILKKTNWKKPRDDKFIETGGNACLLARACESKSQRMLGFHIDSTRLAREVTVGFITKTQAKKALNDIKAPKLSVREVLIKAGIIE